MISDIDCTIDYIYLSEVYIIYDCTDYSTLNLAAAKSLAYSLPMCSEHNIVSI